MEVDAGEDREAAATYLLGESMRLLAADGATLVEVQTTDQDETLGMILLKLGFREVEQAVVLEIARSA